MTKSRIKGCLAFNDYDAGLEVTWDGKLLSFCGSYDGGCPITPENGKLGLRQFFDALAITEVECRRAWR